MESLGNVRYQHKAKSGVMRNEKSLLELRHRSLNHDLSSVSRNSANDVYDDSNLFAREPNYIYKSRQQPDVSKVLQQMIAKEMRSGKKKAPIELDFQKRFRRSTLEMVAKDMIAQSIQADSCKLVKEYPRAAVKSTRPPANSRHFKNKSFNYLKANKESVRLSTKFAPSR